MSAELLEGEGQHCRQDARLVFPKKTTDAVHGFQVLEAAILSKLYFECIDCVYDGD